MKQLEQGVRIVITALLLASVNYFAGFEMAVFLGFAFISNDLNKLNKD